jgi:hypothetical protein
MEYIERISTFITLESLSYDEHKLTVLNIVVNYRSEGRVTESENILKEKRFEYKHNI